jgi:hypothetical protein
MLFVGELIVFSQHLGEEAEHINGSILNGVSIDKSQFVSSFDITKRTILTENKRTIVFTVRLTNHTGTDNQAGSVSIEFLSQGHSISDTAVTSFDLANGTSTLVTVTWEPTVDLDSTACTVITTAYDAANDELGSLNEQLVLD